MLLIVERILTVTLIRPDVLHLWYKSLPVSKLSLYSMFKFLSLEKQQANG